MKRKYLYIFLFIFSFLTCFKYSNICAFQIEGIPINLNVENEDSNYDTPITSYKFEVEAADKSNPMPEGAKDGKVIVTLDKDGSHIIGPIEYDEPGDYVYYISQVKGDDYKFDYDNTTYTATVSVINVDGDEGLAATVSIQREDRDEKFVSVEVVNIYNPHRLPPDEEKPEDKPEEKPEEKPEVTEPQTPEKAPGTSDIKVYTYLAVFLFSTFTVVFVLRREEDKRLD